MICKHLLCIRHDSLAVPNMNACSEYSLRVQARSCSECRVNALSSVHSEFASVCACACACACKFAECTRSTRWQSSGYANNPQKCSTPLLRGIPSSKPIAPQLASNSHRLGRLFRIRASAARFTRKWNAVWASAELLTPLTN